MRNLKTGTLAFISISLTCDYAWDVLVFVKLSCFFRLPLNDPEASCFLDYKQEKCL